MTEIGIVRVAATSDAIARLDAAATTVRLSASEALMLCEPDDEVDVCERIRLELRRDHPGSIVVVDSDAFSAWMVSGSDADTAFTCLSAIELPERRPVFLQGLVAEVPTKIFAMAEHLLLLVGSPVGYHLRARLLQVGARYGVVEGETWRFTTPGDLAS